MIPMFLLARLVVVLTLTGHVAGFAPSQATPDAGPVGHAPMYATAILEGMGGTGWARDINADGTIVGWVSEPDSEVKLPALWLDGELDVLTTPDAPGGVATGINDGGVIVGYVQMPEGDPRPVIWHDGKPAVLETPSEVGYAYAINTAGVVVGEVRDASDEWQPARWEDGQLALFDIGDAIGGQARDINDAGQVAGSIHTADPGPEWGGDDPVRAVMWDRGELRVLGPFGSCAWEISASGVVVGTAPDPAGVIGADGETAPRAVTWADGEMTWIEAGEGMTESLGMAIDDQFGVAISARSGDGPPQALLATLGDPVPLEGISNVSKPEAINEDGVVIGNAFYDDLGFQPVRWIPVLALDDHGATHEVTGPWATLVLPALGGDAEVNDINADGTVVGSVEHASSGVNRPALWRDGQLEVLGGTEGHGGEALGINNAEVVVGVAENGAGESRPVRWDGGTTTDLGTLGGPQGEAEAINTAGQIVGWAETATGARRAVLWDDGEIVDLGTMDDHESMAMDINDAGQILVLIGTEEFLPVHAALWEDGELHPIEPDSGGVVIATAINGDGDVTGLAASADDQAQAFLLEGTVWREIAAPAGRSWFPMAVSDDGTVAGAVFPVDEEDWSAAAIWRDGVQVQLMPETQRSSGAAMAINEHGLVAGSVWFGSDRAVIWIPVAALLPGSV